MKKIIYMLFGTALLLISSSLHAQIYLRADSVNCGDTATILRATLVGATPTSSGITADDGYSGVISIGFPFKYYGTTYNNLVIGSNGVLCFNTGSAGAYCPWPISAALLGNASVYNCICGPWCDVYIPAGGTITYSTVGTAPNRKFAATWCATHMYSCTSLYLTTQIIIYETSNLIEVHIGHRTTGCSWNGDKAICGVQNSSGSAATAAPSRDFPTVWGAINESWRFTPDTSSWSSYSVSSIAYGTIPYSSSTIYWYDSTTGAYLGSGTVMPVPAVHGHTYKAMAAGCADSTFTYYRVDVMTLGAGGSANIHITSLETTHPSECGKCDGTIKLHGVNPFLPDTVFYSVGGILQPPIVATAGSDSTILITGLCAGLYDYVYYKQGPCRSNSIPDTLVNPVLTASFTKSIHIGCSGDTVIFNSTSTPPGYTCVWAYGDGVIDSPASYVNHIYRTQGTYYIKLTYHNNYGCSASFLDTVSLIHPINSVFTLSPAKVCVNTPVTFTNTSVGTSLRYNWEFGDFQTSNLSDPTHSYLQPGNFTVKLTVIDTYGCVSSSTQPVEVIKVYVDADFQDTVVCLRLPMIIKTRTHAIPSSYSSFTYLWNPTTGLSSSTDPNPEFTGVGDFTYTITATEGTSGCTDSKEVVIHSKPPLNLFNVTADAVIGIGQSIQLNADGGYVYQWLPDDGTLDNSRISNPIATPTDSVTVYTVYAMSYYGCKDTAQVVVRVDQNVEDVLPSAFSPNGDGLNDVFRLINFRYQKLVDFRIFNRWGTEVFQTADKSRGWDGTYQNKPQDVGTYYYHVVVANPDGKQKVLKGNFVLVR